MDVILQGKGPWKHVKGTATLETAPKMRSDGREAASAPAVITNEDQKSQKRNLALKHLLTTINLTCGSIVRQIRCPTRVQKSFNDMFRAVSEAAIDVRLALLHFKQLQKGEKIIEH